MEFLPFGPFMIPIAGMLMVVAIVSIVFWFKAREKELQAHQEMRTREMEHQRKMKELELDIEKIKSQRSSGQAA